MQQHLPCGYLLDTKATILLMKLVIIETIFSEFPKLEDEPRGFKNIGMENHKNYSQSHKF